MSTEHTHKQNTYIDKNINNLTKRITASWISSHYSSRACSNLAKNNHFRGRPTIFDNIVLKVGQKFSSLFIFGKFATLDIELLNMGCAWGVCGRGTYVHYLLNRATLSFFFLSVFHTNTLREFSQIFCAAPFKLI